MLRAARDAGVKRVVMTSSTSAIIFGRAFARAFHRGGLDDETNRRDTSPYDRAKTIAERAAWAWLAEEGRGLELVTINPSLVLGPVLGSDFSASIEAIKKLLDGSIPALPRFGFNVVDVRDIARLHVLAMTAPEAAVKRFIGSGDFYWMSDVAKMLKLGLGDEAKKVPSISIPDFVARVVALFDPIVRGGSMNWASDDQSRRRRLDESWDGPPPVTETVLDTARAFTQAIWSEWQGRLRTTRGQLKRRALIALQHEDWQRWDFVFVTPHRHVAGSSVIQDTDGTNSPAQNWNNNRVVINGKP